MGAVQLISQKIETRTHATHTCYTMQVFHPFLIIQVYICLRVSYIDLRIMRSIQFKVNSKLFAAVEFNLHVLLIENQSIFLNIFWAQNQKRNAATQKSDDDDDNNGII